MAVVQQSDGPGVVCADEVAVEGEFVDVAVAGVVVDVEAPASVEVVVVEHIVSVLAAQIAELLSVLGVAD